MNTIVPRAWDCAAYAQFHRARSHGNAALGHASIARLRRRSWVAALCAAASPFPPSSFRILGEKGGSGGWRWVFKAQALCALAVGKRLPKKKSPHLVTDAIRYPRLICSLAKPRIAQMASQGLSALALRWRTKFRCRE